jgi:HNH endonuclease
MNSETIDEARAILNRGVASQADGELNTAWDCFNTAIQLLRPMIRSREALEAFAGPAILAKMVTVIDIGAELDEPATQEQSTDWRARSLRRLRRDGWKCCDCGAGPQTALLQIHHVKWRSRQGSHHLDNLKTLCWECHEKVHGWTFN